MDNRDSVGDCFACRRARRGKTKGGAVVYRCLRADSDSAYPRYPRLPRRHCPGLEPMKG